MPKISVAIITYNEEDKIIRCLDSVRSFADEIVVVDSFSEDRTVSICSDSGCRVFKKFFEGYGTQKQFAAAQALNDWVLSVDADEVLSPELQQELSDFSRKQEVPYNGYRFLFPCFIWEGY